MFFRNYFCRVFALTICLVVIFLVLCPWVDANTEKKEENRSEKISKFKYDMNGLDPHAYPTAEEMYKIFPTQPGNPDILLAIEALDSELKAGRMPEEDEIWTKFSRLNPHRHLPEVQNAILRWVTLRVSKIDLNDKTVSYDDIHKADSLYRQGELQEASDIYRSLIKQAPGHLDARNNLALAEMHLGNDLYAQLQWEILYALRPDYLPARINLTVLYERARWRSKAQKMAADLMPEAQDVPMAVFNHAWYLNHDKQYAQATRILHRMDTLGLPSKYRVFYGHNREESNLWRVGIIGKFGGRTSTISMCISVFLFFILSCFMMVIVGVMGGMVNNADNAGSAGFLLYAIIGGITYILCWGLPGGWYWAMFVIYLVICGGISAAVAKDF